MPAYHEDEARFQNDLINQRLTWLAAFEGLLFVANHYSEHPYLLPLIGFAIAVSVDVSIRSANQVLTMLRAQAYSGWKNHLMPGTAIPKIIAVAWLVLFLENFKRLLLNYTPETRGTTSMFIQAALPAVETTHLGLKTSEWIMVAAIVVGPFAAVLTQLCVQKRREIQNQKLWVFGTLMSLRAAVLHPDFVRALNYIDVVFYKNEKIRAKWKTLLNYLASDAHKPGNVTQQVLDKTRDLLAELLAEIAKELGYAYDHTHIKENAYYPTGHGLVEEQMAQIRQKVIAVLDSKASLSFKRV